MTDKENADNKLVLLNDFEQKIARVLWPGIDVQEPWTPEGQALVQQSIEKLKEIFNISEEPVSEDLEEAALNYSFGRFKEEKMSVQRRCARIGFRAGANWKEQQMMKDAIDAKLSFGQPVLLSHPVSPQIAKDGDKVKLIIAKETE